jgi:chromosome segregation ATPase
VAINQLDILRAQAGAEFNRIHGAQGSLAQQKVSVQERVQGFQQILDQMVNELAGVEQELNRLGL